MKFSAIKNIGDYSTVTIKCEIVIVMNLLFVIDCDNCKEIMIQIKVHCQSYYIYCENV